MTLPNPGDTIHITKEAGPAVHPMLARVIRVSDRQCWEGWAEYEVAELHTGGVAGAPRMAYVNLAGVRVVRTAETAAQTRQRLLAEFQHNGHPAAWTPIRPRTSTENGRAR